MTRRERVRGCLLGGAVGDALGAPVEFLSRGAILARYGPGGIREMDEAYGVVGALTDDTQMTLFTAEGLMRAMVRSVLRGVCNPVAIVALAYRRWLVTQGERPRPDFDGVRTLSAASPEPLGWLFGVEGLHRRRAPGNTCLSALRDAPDVGTSAVNESKGCGGVMRVAPVGLFVNDPYSFGCDVAAITHGHPLGWVSAGVFAWIVASVVAGESPGEAVARFAAAPTFLAQDPSDLLDYDRGGERGALATLGALAARAAELAASHAPAHEAIPELGEGWVAEEALAIALYCALRHPDDLEAGIVAGANHDGDSDSTAAMTGQLLGASLGEAAIPRRWLAALEMREVVARIADDLDDMREGRAFVSKGGWPDSAPGWWERYPGC